MPDFRANACRCPCRLPGPLTTFSMVAQYAERDRLVSSSDNQFARRITVSRFTDRLPLYPPHDDPMRSLPRIHGHRRMLEHDKQVQRDRVGQRRAHVTEFDGVHRYRDALALSLLTTRSLP